MATDVRVWPDIAIPPGELLAETLETLGMSQAELARRAGRPVQAVNEIIRGTKEITPETALQFECVLGVPAHIWTRLEPDYRYNKARLEDQARLKGELPSALRYPYAAMAALGWVRRTGDALERVQELLRFFGVASLQHVPEIEAAAFRKSAKLQPSPEALAAWLRQGEREAQQAPVGWFSAHRVRAALPELRALTRRPPEEFVNRNAGQQLSRLPELATELVRSGVDVIVTSINPATLAAKKATTTIPIVMTVGVEPVGAGLVASLAKPGGQCHRADSRCGCDPARRETVGDSQGANAVRVPCRGPVESGLRSRNVAVQGNGTSWASPSSLSS